MKYNARKVGGGVGIIGAGIMWAYLHLGVLFFALLALVFLNLIMAIVEKDIGKAAQHWMKVLAGVVVPTVIPMFSHTASITWSVADTKLTIAAMFAALFAATWPQLSIWFGDLLGKLGVSKQDSQALLNAANARVAQLEAQVQAQSPNTAAVASPTVFIAPVTSTNYHAGV